MSRNIKIINEYKMNIPLDRIATMNNMKTHEVLNILYTTIVSDKQSKGK